MSKKNYKFNIEQKLNELTYAERDKALKQLPEQLGISSYSFYIWRRIKDDSPQDIPSTKLVALSRFFKCTIDELVNSGVPTISLKSSKQSRSVLQKKYNMSNN